MALMEISGQWGPFSVVGNGSSGHIVAPSITPDSWVSEENSAQRGQETPRKTALPIPNWIRRAQKEWQRKRGEKVRVRGRRRSRRGELNKTHQASGRSHKVSWTHSRTPLISSESEGTGTVGERLLGSCDCCWFDEFLEGRTCLLMSLRQIQS